MWSLARLLTSQSGTPLSTLSMAFPCPSLPSDEQRASADADSRMQHGSSSQAPSFLTAATSVSWEGLGVVGDQNRYAECLVLQSPRAGGAAVPLSRASGMLDAALMRDDPLRCVRHRVLTAQPLPVPLPFPGLFASTVTRWGDVGSGAHGAGNGHHVDSCPILVRLAGSTAIGWEVRRLGQQFASAAGTAHGQAVLDGWGVDRDMREDVHERLASLAQAPLEELG